MPATKSRVEKVRAAFLVPKALDRKVRNAAHKEGCWPAVIVVRALSEYFASRKPAPAVAPEPEPAPA